jgi:hypothetical protein
VQNSAILGSNWREAGIRSGYYKGCRIAGTVGTRESEGCTDSLEELCGYPSTGFDLCGGQSCVSEGLAEERNPQV